MLRSIVFVALLSFACSLLLVLLVASTAGSAPSTTCSAAQKAQRQRAVHTYQTKMQAARKAYFKTHKGKRQRATFVKRQQVKLKSLSVRRAAR